MEAATAVTEAPVTEIIEPAAKNATAAKMFKYSTFVDVGDGAEGCEHARDGQCGDVEHFHAWCRLPNNYQHEDIRKKALAAKARALRALRDPESDMSVILDTQLAQVNDALFADTLIDEILQGEWGHDYLEAQRDTEEREEFEHIAQDREEFTRLDAEEKELPEEQWSDEYKRLREHVQTYLNAAREALEARQQPRREELRNRPVEALVDLVRSKRIEQEADRAFAESYDAWMWFVGTYQVELHPSLGRPHKPAWEEIGRPDRGAPGTMFGESPEVIDGLRHAYMDLRIAMHQGSTEGN